MPSTRDSATEIARGWDYTSLVSLRAGSNCCAFSTAARTPISSDSCMDFLRSTPAAIPAARQSPQPIGLITFTLGISIRSKPSGPSAISGAGPWLTTTHSAPRSRSSAMAANRSSSEFNLRPTVRASSSRFGLMTNGRSASVSSSSAPRMSRMVLAVVRSRRRRKKIGRSRFRQ